MLYLRNATAEDMDLLFKWANDSSVRNNAFHPEPIEYETHRRWYKRILECRDQKQYILTDDGNPIGQIRLSKDGDGAEIDYSIAPDKRGLGYGKIILRLALEKICSEYPDISKLTAKVKPSNLASIYCFEKSNFKEIYRQYEFELKK